MQRVAEAPTINRRKEVKSIMKYLVLGFAVSLLVAGCAKPPTEELAKAQAAIDASVAAGANVYGKDELKNLNDGMTQANELIKGQEGKLFKKYDEAKAVIAKVTADAATLEAAIPARKAEAKKKAEEAAAFAKTAVADAKALLAKAPKGKGTKADIEAMTADLKGVEESLPAIDQAIAAEDYFGAADKAKAASDKAAMVSEQVKAAMDKVKGKK
jgi:hypothetical protein